MPGEVKALMQGFASDNVGIHPTAHLIKRLKFIPTHECLELKIILAAFKHDEYFISLRDANVDWDYVRSYSTAYFKVQ